MNNNNQKKEYNFTVKYRVLDFYLHINKTYNVLPWQISDFI